MHIRLFTVIALLTASLGVHATSSQFELLLDMDGNSSSGCEVATPDGTFAGIDVVLTTYVESSGPEQAQVTSIERRECVDSASNQLGPAQLISDGDWPVGFGNGQAGFNVIETFMPTLASSRFSDIRIVLVASDDFGNTSVLSSGASGFPITIEGDPPLPVPLAATVVLLGLALTLLLIGLFMIGRRNRLTLTALVCLTGGGMAGAACILDGQIFNWDLADLLAETSATDPENGVDIRALFGKRTSEDTVLCFRIDAALVFAVGPEATDDEYTTVATMQLDVPAAQGLLANDALGVPEAELTGFGGGDLGGTVTDQTAGTTVALGADGSLTVNADGAFQFQAESGFEGTIVFEYQIENAGGTSQAQVTIQVQTSPAATDDSFTMLAGETFDLPAPGVLDNDTGLPAPSVVSFGGGDLSGDVGDFAAGSTATIAPDGSIVINANGSLTFTPPSGTDGEFSFDYRIENEAGASEATITFSVNSPPVITSADTLDCEFNSACSFTFAADGYPAPTFNLPDLPDGLSLNANSGLLQGTPEEDGVFDLTLTATNAVGSDQQDFTLTVILPDITYCIPAHPGGCSSGDTINDFIIDGVFQHLNTGCSANDYGDFTGDPALTIPLAPLTAYDFTINHDFSSQRVKIWIDFNRDGVFDDATELVYASPTGANPTIGQFATDDVGPIETRMRVMTRWSTEPANACDPGGGWGETHDYTVVIE